MLLLNMITYLILTANHNASDAMELLLNLRVNYHSRNYQGSRAVHYAASYGSEVVLEKLLAIDSIRSKLVNYEFPVKYRGATLHTPLECALNANSLARFKMILDVIKNPDELTSAGVNILNRAIEKNKTEFVSLLLQNGANPHVINNDKTTLYQAYEVKNSQISKLLLEYNVNPFLTLAGFFAMKKSVLQL